jgi:hypothetical protein
MSKGKAKAGSGGAGGGPSTKAAAAGGSSGQGSSRPSAPPARIIGFRTEEDAVQATPPLAAEAAGAAQQTEPEPEPAGGGKKEKERLRKERQKHRKMEGAWEALRGAVEGMEETAGAGCVAAVEAAIEFAVKHEARSEPLAALVALARDLVEQARAAEAERVRVAAEEAAAAVVVSAAATVVAAAERLRLEQELAALTLSVQSEIDAEDAACAGSAGRVTGGTRTPPR